MALVSQVLQGMSQGVHVVPDKKYALTHPLQVSGSEEQAVQIALHDTQYLAVAS